MSNRIRQIGIIMNGVTGRMGTNQHLLRSIVAIIQQGGIRIGEEEVIMPDPILVGRNPEKLEKLAAQAGGCRWTTNLDEALADPRDEIYFDAQTTARRVEAVKKAIAAGKHVYCEKPTATNTAEALELYRLAQAGRREKRRRAGQALAAGDAEIEAAHRRRFLRPDPFRSRRVRLLGFRRRHDSRATPRLELSERGRRRHYHRHALPLPLRARQSLRRSPGGFLPRRNARAQTLGRRRPCLRLHRRGRRLLHFRIGRRRHRPDRRRLVLPRPPGRSACRSRSMEPRAAPSPDCATAGRSPTPTRRAPIWNPDVESPVDYYDELAGGRIGANLCKCLQSRVGALSAPRCRRTSRSAGPCSKAPRACSLPKKAKNPGERGVGSIFRNWKPDPMSPQSKSFYPFPRLRVGKTNNSRGRILRWTRHGPDAIF